jgi:hypothetical protein
MRKLTLRGKPLTRPDLDESKFWWWEEDTGRAVS